MHFSSDSTARDLPITTHLNTELDLHSHIGFTDIKQLTNDQYKSLFGTVNDIDIDYGFIEDSPNNDNMKDEERDFLVNSDLSPIQYNTMININTIQHNNIEDYEYKTPRKNISNKLYTRLLCAPYKKSIINVPAYIYKE